MTQNGGRGAMPRRAPGGRGLCGIDVAEVSAKYQVDLLLVPAFTQIKNTLMIN